MNSMSIDAKHGDKVIFSNPNNGYELDKEQAKEHLILNKVYTVDYTIVHGWCTDVALVEIPNQHFNSVLFSDYKEDFQMPDMNDIQAIKEWQTALSKLSELKRKKLFEGESE